MVPILDFMCWIKKEYCALEIGTGGRELSGDKQRVEVMIYKKKVYIYLVQHNIEAVPKGVMIANIAHEVH